MAGITTPTEQSAQALLLDALGDELRAELGPGWDHAACTFARVIARIFDPVPATTVGDRPLFALRAHDARPVAAASPPTAHASAVAGHRPDNGRSGGEGGSEEVFGAPAPVGAHDLAQQLWARARVAIPVDAIRHSFLRREIRRVAHLDVPTATSTFNTLCRLGEDELLQIFDHVEQYGRMGGRG